MLYMSKEAAIYAKGWPEFQGWWDLENEVELYLYMLEGEWLREGHIEKWKHSWTETISGYLTNQLQFH